MLLLVMLVSCSLCPETPEYYGPCNEAGICDESLVCFDGYCTLECQSDSECGRGMLCLDDHCADDWCDEK